jgi:hypothetical protein
MAPMSRLLALPILALLVAGCMTTDREGGGPYPDACLDHGLDARRCQVVVAELARRLGIEGVPATSVELLPEQPCEPPPGALCTRTTRFIARARFHLVDGRTLEEAIYCGVYADDDRICNPDPKLAVSGGVDRDIPCGADGETCATPPPRPRPASVAAAEPLEVDAINIPLDHTGLYAVKVGDAGLPDGVLSERRGELADPKPTTFWLDGPVRIEVRPLEAGRPPVGNIYRDPYDGVEPVAVFLVFDVIEMSPGAVLQVRNVIVR